MIKVCKADDCFKVLRGYNKSGFCTRCYGNYWRRMKVFKKKIANMRIK